LDRGEDHTGMADPIGESGQAGIDTLTRDAPGLAEVFRVARGCAIGPKNRWRRRMSDTPLAIHTVGPEGFALMTGPTPARDASASPGQGWPQSNGACRSAE